MPVTHSGKTAEQIAIDAGNVILAAYQGKPVEIVPEWTLSYLNDDETQDAGRDEKTGNIDRWDVLPFNDAPNKESMPCLTSTGGIATGTTIERTRVDTLVLKFRYSVSVEGEKDDQNKTSSNRFFERLEAVGNEFTVTPLGIVMPKFPTHNELIKDKIGIVSFRREFCHEAVCRLTVTYSDSVTKI